jgi:polysaccharide biosynthesis protein PelG
VVLTGITLSLGPAFYGYGFALALLATVVISMVFMEKKLATLEYETFMLQRT